VGKRTFTNTLVARLLAVVVHVRDVLLSAITFIRPVVAVPENKTKKSFALSWVVVRDQ